MDTLPLTERLKANVERAVDGSYSSAITVPYDTAVHQISSALNDRYQPEWQTARRGHTFKDEVARLLISIMYSRNMPLNRESWKSDTGKLIVPSVKRQKIEI